MLESKSLTRKAEQAVMAAIESHDAHGARTKRFSLLFVGSALLHVVAVLAILRSWSSGPTRQAAKEIKAVAKKTVKDVQVVRLELAVSPLTADEAIKAATAEINVTDSDAVKPASAQESP